MVEALSVEKRENFGSKNSQRMRRDGRVPAVLYGHKEETVSLSVGAAAIETLVRHGARLVELKGSVNESALIREIQWNVYGTKMLHIDFTRVSAEESVDATLTVELRGNAPGAKMGGVVGHLLHEIQIRCPAVALVEKVSLSINRLELDQTITADAVELPEGATLLTDADAIIVQCVAATDDAEGDEEGAGGHAEPEVIGRKDDDAAEEK